MRADAGRVGRRAAAAGRARRRRTSSCTRPPGRTSTAPRTTRRARPRSTSAAPRNVAALGVPLVVLLDRLRLRRPQGRAVRRVGRPESRVGATGGRSSTARRPPASRRGSSAPRGSSGRRGTTSSARCCGSARSATRSRSSTTSAAARPTSATSPRRRVRFCSLPYGVYHVAAEGDCTWADFAEAIFEEAGLDCRVRRITTAEFGAAGAAARVLGAAVREGRARAAALARGAARDDRGHPGGHGDRIEQHGELLVPDDLGPRGPARGRLGRDLRDRAVAARGGAASRSVEKLEHGNGDGIGALYRHEWRSVIPSPVRFETRITQHRAAVPDRGARPTASSRAPAAGASSTGARRRSPPSGTCARPARG